MKPLLLLAVTILVLYSCKKKQKDISKVYCQGFVEKVIEQDPSGEELSRKFTLRCNGECPDKKKCEILSITYDPAKPDGLIKEEWCGCKGDKKPQGCDVVLKTYNTNGRVIQQADCTPFNTCPVKTDSCIQQPDKDARIDTLRSVNGKDSIYRFTGIIMCECMNRKNN